MKLTWKDFIYYVLICFAASSLIYLLLGNILLAASIWAIYGLCLVLGGFFEYILSPRVSPLHMQIITGWIIYFTFSLLVTGIDYLILSPPLMEALHFDYPLSFSLALWGVYGGFMVLFTLGYYFFYTSCSHCKGIIFRRRKYCHKCT